MSEQSSSPDDARDHIRVCVADRIKSLHTPSRCLITLLRPAPPPSFAPTLSRHGDRCGGESWRPVGDLVLSVYNCYPDHKLSAQAQKLLSHPQQLRYGHEPSVAQQGSPPTGRCRVLQREYLNYYHENRGQKSFVPSSFPHQDNEHFLNTTILFGYTAFTCKHVQLTHT